jgi:hypothetical protein
MSEATRGQSAQIERLRHATRLADRTCQGRRAVAPQKRAGQLRGADGPHLQRPGHPQQVVPMADDQLGTHPMPRQTVQRAIVGRRISPACSRCVAGRSRYLARRVGSATTNWRPRWATTPGGTSVGLARKVPRNRAVTNCSAKPNRFWSPRCWATRARSASSRWKYRASCAGEGSPA